MKLLFIKLITICFFILNSFTAYSQDNGLKEIIKIQQDKISLIEDNLKSLIGKIENKINDKTNVSYTNNKLDKIKSQLDKLSIQLKNLTDFSYELEFKINRIEANLKLSPTLQSKSKRLSDVDVPKTDGKTKADIKKVGLEPKTTGVLGFVKDKNVEYNNKSKPNGVNQSNKGLQSKYPKSPEDHYKLAQKLLLNDLNKAEAAFKEFIILHKGDEKVVDAEYWLGRVLFKQKKYSQAALALAEFNGKYPEDKRYEQTTLLIAEATSKYAPKDVLCKILMQTENIIENPSKKFIKKISELKNLSSCF